LNVFILNLKPRLISKRSPRSYKWFKINLKLWRLVCGWWILALLYFVRLQLWLAKYRSAKMCGWARGKWRFIFARNFDIGSSKGFC